MLVKLFNIDPTTPVQEARRILRIHQLEPLPGTNIFECRMGDGGKRIRKLKQLVLKG